MSASSIPDQAETVIIGAGQAGLALGQQLAQRDRRFVILDALDRVGDNWRRHYDSLRLYSPACIDGLPGLPFPAPPYHYPTRDEMADYLQTYAEHFDLPVHLRTRVDQVRPGGDGYVVSTTSGQRISAANVVVATGTFGRPHTPGFAVDLDPTIVQMHSSQYRRPAQLQPGPVLVVGASHSGSDIALEVATEHDTVLAGRDTGQVPFDVEGPAMRVLRRVLPFVTTKVLTIRTPIGRKIRPKIREHGAPLLRVKRKHLAAARVERAEERVVAAHDGRPQLDGGRVLDVANVIWATGFRQDFSWIRLPIVGDDGWPRETRGVVDDAPGLYFMGLAFQYAFGSMLLVGVEQDARHVAAHIAQRNAGRPEHLAPTASAEPFARPPSEGSR